MNELEALREVDFNWTLHLQNIWTDPAHDVPGVHAAIRGELGHKLDRLIPNVVGAPSPLGWVILGGGGSGKTHLMSSLRREAQQRGYFFVLVDMTDVHDFWSTVCLGYLTSLWMPCNGKKLQHQVLLEKFLSNLSLKAPLDQVVAKLTTATLDEFAREVSALLNSLRLIYPAKKMQHQDSIRALMALNSQNDDVSNAGNTWLQGQDIGQEFRSRLCFSKAQESPEIIVQGLSWLMSFGGPTILAFDQLDPIVSQLHIAATAGTADGEQLREEIACARMIIESIVRGFSSLYDCTSRTFSVVSCVDESWNKLRQIAFNTNFARFEPPRVLLPLSGADLAQSVVSLRLNAGYRLAGFVPPYPSWPFHRTAFEKLQGVEPRRLLQLCEQHKIRCVEKGAVVELRDFAAVAHASDVCASAPSQLALFDATFQRLQTEADPEKLLENRCDDELLAPLLQAACRCLLRENPLPDNIDHDVDDDFPGGKSSPPLHARLRLIYHDEQGREEHFCIRALQWDNPRAFQSRLSQAMTQSGIDRQLSFRRLVVVRSGDLPTGTETERLVTKFKQAGGLFAKPTDDELRTLWALKQMESAPNEDFDDWLRERKPASKLELMKLSVPKLTEHTPTGATSDDLPFDGNISGASTFQTGQSADQKQHGELHAEFPPGSSAKPRVASSADRPKLTEPPANQQPAARAGGALLLGHRWQAGQAGQSLTMPVKLLEKHTVVLAGAGSGKTVLLRRLIEEAALAGIPSIVIDCANDLSTLADRWPQSPAERDPEDEAKAGEYFEGTDVVVWTPGREAGNPLRFEPLPDFSAVANDPDELSATVDMATEGLRDLIAAGTTPKAQNMRGVLSCALRFFAKQGGGTLERFVSLLADLPPDAGLGIKDEAKLAREMADRLKVEREKNVLLRNSGAALDPAILFGDDVQPRRPRVSVINFVGLPSLEVQRQFLNQLAMTLFAWIKKNPEPRGRELRGLLVIDEAKDFVPSQKTCVCKESLMRLTAQARKYHLGVVFATQNPKEIENTLIGNCSTHFYGKANSPTAIETVREQIAQRGGTGQDIGTLPRGVFYVYNADADLRAPTKIRVPLCLSHHAPNPLTEVEILRRAAVSRQRFLSDKST